MGGSPALSLVDMLHVTGGGFGSQCFPFLCMARLFWAVCLPGLLVFAPLFLFSLPFLGAFFL